MIIYFMLRLIRIKSNLKLEKSIFSKFTYCDLAQNGNIVAIFVEVRRFTANQESEGPEVWGGVIRLYLASPEINIISTTPLKKVSGEKFLLNFASQQQFKQF